MLAFTYVLHCDTIELLSLNLRYNLIITSNVSETTSSFAQLRELLSTYIRIVRSSLFAVAHHNYI